MLILDHKIEFFLSGGGDGGYSDIESRTVRVDVSKEWDTSLFQHVLSWKRIVSEFIHMAILYASL